MAVNFLAELSPTFREKTKKTATRKALVVAHLTDRYELPDGGADAVVALMREESRDLPSLNRSAVYEDRDPSRTAYVYLDAGPEVRDLMDAKRSVKTERGGQGEYLGINSLLQDHPDIKTWQDVQEKLSALPASPAPASVAAPPSTEVSGDEILAETFPPPPKLDGKLRGITASIERFHENLEVWIHTLQAEAGEAQEEMRRLARENAFLRARLTEYAQSGDNARVTADIIEGAVSDLANFFSIAASGLPDHTAVSGAKGGWAGEFKITYSEDFQDRFFGGYLALHERNQTVKALNNFAREGRFYPGLNTKKFMRRLPGVPIGTRWYHYSRAADDIRFTWKQVEGVIYIFNVHNKNELD